MKVQDIMIRDVYSAHRDELVRTILEKFSLHRISGMPIIDDKKNLVGYISDGDIMRYLGRHLNPGFSSFINVIGYYSGIVPDDVEGSVPPVDEFRKNALEVCNRKAIDVGVKRVITVKEDDSLVYVAELLGRRNIKKVPVVREKQLVGILSRGDVVRAAVQQFLIH